MNKTKKKAAPTPLSSRARSIALGKCARKTLMLAALSEQITMLVERYDLDGDEIRRVFTEKERAYIAKVQERLNEKIPNQLKAARELHRVGHAK